MASPQTFRETSLRPRSWVVEEVQLLQESEPANSRRVARKDRDEEARSALQRPWSSRSRVGTDPKTVLWNL